MDRLKTTRVDIRMSPVLRGQLAEVAGDGKIATAARNILENHFKKKGKGREGRAA